jgi:hypothetical protein
MKQGGQTTAPPRPLFFRFSRLFIQWPAGSFRAEPLGIFRAWTLEEALTRATIETRSRLPVLLRLDDVTKPE